MKKLVMFLVVAMLSMVSVMGVEYKAADMPDYQKDKAAYLAYWKSVTGPASVMVWKLQEMSAWQVKLGEVAKTAPAITALVDANAVSCGVTDADVIIAAKALCLRCARLYTESLTLLGNSTHKLCLTEKAWNLYQLNRYTEAMPLFIAVNQPFTAFRCAVAAKDNVKAFELAKSLTMNAYATPGMIIQILDALGEMNFEGSAVTKDMEIAFLKALNEKYSRFLLKDRVTWEPIIAGIRLTIEVKQSK